MKVTKAWVDIDLELDVRWAHGYRWSSGHALVVTMLLVRVSVSVVTVVSSRKFDNWRWETIAICKDFYGDSTFKQEEYECEVLTSLVEKNVFAAANWLRFLDTRS
ncbi:unnamed protein product [Amaranthus hypochondriacus]